jgi:predicted transcriptional regulator
MLIFIQLDSKRADTVFAMLRDGGFTKNQSKILAMLEQVSDVGLPELTLYLGMSSSRASESLKTLLRTGYIMAMDVKYVMGKGRSRRIYRLKMPIEEILSDSRRRVAVMITYRNNIDP